jgi:hypothetical protein
MDSHMNMLRRNIPFLRLFCEHVINLVGSGLTSVALGLFAHQLVGPSAHLRAWLSLKAKRSVAPLSNRPSGWSKSITVLNGSIVPDPERSSPDAALNDRPPPRHSVATRPRFTTIASHACALFVVRDALG